MNMFGIEKRFAGKRSIRISFFKGLDEVLLLFIMYMSRAVMDSSLFPIK